MIQSDPFTQIRFEKNPIIDEYDFRALIIHGGKSACNQWKMEARVDESFDFYAWAVRDGNVSAVPLPPAVWSFESGLIGLVLGDGKRCS